MRKCSPCSCGSRNALLGAIRVCVTLCVLWTSPGAHAGTMAPDPLHAIDELANDDPRAANAQVQRLLDSTSSVNARFWTLLAGARVKLLLETPAAAASYLDQAEALLKNWPEATTRHRHWLAYERAAVNAMIGPRDAKRLQAQRLALSQEVRDAADVALRCEIVAYDLWLLQETYSYDEAWLAAEDLRRCGAEVSSMPLLVSAHTAIGRMLARGHTPSLRMEAAMEHFNLALQLLDQRPARLRRSLIEWDISIAQIEANQWQAALPHIQNAMGYSRAIGDVAGVAAGNIQLARVYLKLSQPELALPAAREAEQLLIELGDGFRRPQAAEQLIRALAMLKHPQVMQAITQARSFDHDKTQPKLRAALVRAMAEGLASQGQYAPAYEEMRRAQGIESQLLAESTDTQVLRLKARYDAVRREAETAELRHRSETAQLALQAQDARQQTLWLVIVGMALTLTVGAAVGWRAITRRHALAELALRDELTGQPNRRAITAYAQAQFRQARRLGVPLSVALLDLDHFKLVNDSHGHAVGDAVLRAMAQAANQVLRGQDRFGRWGGEEWLLVLPGTSVEEIPAVFERLRNAFADMPADGLLGLHGCTFSMGAAQVELDTAHLEALVAAADAQLYMAKTAGRNQLCFHQQVLPEPQPAKVRLAQA